MTIDNPSAFPLNATNDGTPGAFCPDPGMSLRDWFAGQALPGTFVGETDSAITELGRGREQESNMIRAQYCYEMADAMLAARATTASKEGE